MDNGIHSYGKVWNLTHREVSDLLNAPCIVEEKIDGSQFSFQLKDGEILFRSKGAVIQADNPPDIFKAAVDSAIDAHREIGLTPGWTYRGEALKGRGHNVLTYERAPARSVVIWDIDTGEQDLLDWVDKAREAKRLGYDVAPRLYFGYVTLDILNGKLSRRSVLGGEIEGLVIKRTRENTLYGFDGKVLVGKFVSDKYRESHKSSPQWKSINKKDIIGIVISKHSTEARWQKVAQHLEEEGELEFSVRDISKLIKRLQQDIRDECFEEIGNDLAEYYWRSIMKGAPRGMAEWWKDRLLKETFQDGAS